MYDDQQKQASEWGLSAERQSHETLSWSDCPNVLKHDTKHLIGLSLDNDRIIGLSLDNDRIIGWYHWPGLVKRAATREILVYMLELFIFYIYGKFYVQQYVYWKPVRVAVYTFQNHIYLVVLSYMLSTRSDSEWVCHINYQGYMYMPSIIRKQFIFTDKGLI